MEENKKNLLTREGLKKYEDELQELKVVKRKEVSQKLKEARAQGDLSENAEYDAAKDEQRDIEARIFELEQLLKNVEVVDVDSDEGDGKKIAFGYTVTHQSVDHLFAIVDFQCRSEVGSCLFRHLFRKIEIRGFHFLIGKKTEWENSHN